MLPVGATRPAGVILISIDTLRADRLGAYGWHRATSPAIDRLAREGVLYEHVSAHAPSTLLSHASLFTSIVPQRHGASHVRGRLPDPGLSTLAEAFAEAGYRTAAFHDGGQMAPEFGLDRGFDIFVATPHDDGHRFAETAEVALEWIADRDDPRPFFLFLHTYEVHHPYRPPAQLWRQVAPGGPPPTTVEIVELEEANWGGVTPSADRRAAIEIAYEVGIRSVDEAIARFRSELETLELWDDILVAVTSDHGEEFGEHGWIGWHSHTLFEELLHVPLVLVGPGVPAGGRMRESAQLIDLAPTLLALAGIEPPSSFEGQSLAWFDPEHSRPTSNRPHVAFGETEQRRFEAIRNGSWKLNDGRLYDLATDPGETLDRSAAEPQRRAAFERALERVDRPRSAATVDQLAPETLESLRSLGYISRPR